MLPPNVAALWGGCLCARFLPAHTAAALAAWATPSAPVLYAAFYPGSGAGLGGELVRLRYLTGPKGGHHGLRPIRVRLVAYLVAPLKARALAPEVAAALAAALP